MEDQQVENQQSNEQPEVNNQQKAAECAGKINDLLNEYGFMLAVAHEVITKKLPDGKTELDIDHQIRFLNQKS